MTRFLMGSIRNKLLLITGLATAVVIACALFGMYRLQSNIAGFEQLMSQDVALERDVTHLEVAFNEQVRDWKDMLLGGDNAADREQYWNAFLRQGDKLRKAAADLRGRAEAPAARDALDQFLNAHSSMIEAYKQGYAVYRQNGFDARRADDTVRGATDAPLNDLNTAQAAIEKAAAARAETQKARAGRDVVLSLVLVGISVVVSFLVFVWLLQRMILQPANRLVEDLDRLAEGDFTREIQKGGDDELGRLAGSAHKIQSGLGHVLGEVADAVAHLASASEELSAVSEQTRQGVNRQKEETNDVAAAMNEMTATVQEVARNASEAANSAHEADGSAKQGRQVVAAAIEAINLVATDVEQVGEAIARLDEDSTNIGTVLDVIRGVAEQTNLLALNAAIEAARAGEQGRGFAVVADEVRSLAQRTQESTQEIHDMIERLQLGTRQTVEVMSHSTTQTESAVQRAREAGEALESITTAVASINDMNTQIASAAEEQSSVAEEMNRNVVNINQVADESSESVAHTTRASDELAKLAADLQGLVDKFRIGRRL